MFENAVEAIFGMEIEDDLTQVLDADGNPVGEYAESPEAENAETNSDFADYSDVYTDAVDTAPVSVEFNFGDDTFGNTEGDGDSDVYQFINFRYLDKNFAVVGFLIFLVENRRGNVFYPDNSGVIPIQNKIGALIKILTSFSF